MWLKPLFSNSKRFKDCIVESQSKKWSKNQLTLGAVLLFRTTSAISGEVSSNIKNETPKSKSKMENPKIEGENRDSKSRFTWGDWGVPIAVCSLKFYLCFWRNNAFQPRPPKIDFESRFLLDLGCLRTSKIIALRKTPLFAKSPFFVFFTVFWRLRERF